MEFAEKLVMRRKRPLLADTLTFSVPAQKVYKEYGLLDDKMLPDIMIEKTDFGQMSKFLETLQMKGSNTFEKFCDFLVGEGHSWLRDEMKADLLAEKGELEVEEYVYRESGMHVHRRFGKSKRISEVEKKELQALIALRYQAAKEAWQHQLNLLKRQLEEAQQAQWGENGKMRGLVDKISTFLLVQKPKLNNFAHDLIHALDLIREDPDPENNQRDYYRLLEEILDRLLETLARVLLEKESMRDERERCLAVLKIDRPVVRLDLVLEESLQRAAEDMVRSRREADMSDKMAKSLDENIKVLRLDTDRELACRNSKIQYLESLLRQRDDKTRQLERLLAEAKNSCSEANDELERWKKKCEMLEKTRRLGYYYPGWQDKLYNMNDIDYSQEEVENPGPPKLVLIGNKREGLTFKRNKTIDMSRSHDTFSVSRQTVVMRKNPQHTPRRKGTGKLDDAPRRAKTSLVFSSSNNC